MSKSSNCTTSKTTIRQRYHSTKVTVHLIDAYYGNMCQKDAFEFAWPLTGHNIWVLWLRVKWKSLSHVWLFATPWTIQSMEFSRPEYWSGQPFPSPGDLPNPGIELRSLALQVDSFPAEPQGKPRNTGVGSLSLLQGIFPTQESNQDLLHCRQILYQLSYQGSPLFMKPREESVSLEITVECCWVVLSRIWQLGSH